MRLHKPENGAEEARVEAARTLLGEGQRGLKEVASHCGFGSADVMRRAFARILGVTAREYADHFRGRL